jgi:hypothetical protein
MTSPETGPFSDDRYAADAEAGTSPYANEGGYSADKTIEAETTVSPKVAAGAITSAALVVLLAIITAVTPDMVDGLGQWGTLVYAGIVALGGVIASYIKRDPLREV